jgi:hypothetical protein
VSHGAPECSARILAAITFHFRRNRLHFLFEVVRALAEFPLNTVDVVVVTNVDDEAQLTKIKELCEPLFESFPGRPTATKTFSIENVTDLDDPWRLPWAHKHLIADTFLRDNTPYTHFIYVEDDILLSYYNLLYYIRYRELLKPHGVIPSFQRIEYNSIDNRLYLSDQIGVSAERTRISSFNSRKRVDLDGYAFVNLDFPYNAMFILDRDLAIEYVHSQSFDRVTSRPVQPEWSIAARAAMGLCFENPPPGFKNRYVSPVNPKTLIMPHWSWVYHVANNYVNNKYTPLAKSRIDQLFASETELDWRPPPKIADYLRRARRKLARVPTLAGKE